MLACGCVASGDGCSVQHRRDWPGTDKGILEGGRLGNPGDSLCWLQDRAGASAPTASARGRVPVRLTPSAGKGRAGPSETNCRRPPVRRGQVWGLGGQSSEPHLACPVVATAAVLVGTWWQAGCERAAPGRPPARSHPSSASPTGQLRMWTIYTGRGGRAAQRRAAQAPYVGMTDGTRACQGDGGPKLHLSWVPFKFTKSPLTPPPRDRQLPSSPPPPRCLKIPQVTAALDPQLPSAHLHALVHTHTPTPALSLALPMREVGPHGGDPTPSTTGSFGCPPPG